MFFFQLYSGFCIPVLILIYWQPVQGLLESGATLCSNNEFVCFCVKHSYDSFQAFDFVLATYYVPI